MNRRTGFSLAVVATVILVLFQFNPPAWADDQDNGDDPPARAGRISDTEGSVSFQPGGQGDWLDAVRNRPLTVGDNLWVDKDSRAEIEIGSTSIRLGPETSITILDLGDDVTQLRLSLGSILFRVRHFDSGETFEVDTPNLAFSVNQEGEFRLDANQDGDQTVAAIFHGAAEITGAGNSYSLREGQQGTFSGTDQLNYDVGEIAAPDSFTQWAFSRDQREDRSRSRQYVSDQMTGYDDLDDYGQWRADPEYGNVWTPTAVPVGWAPYRFGHWAYVYPWGWTWVEDEPWGFAPFHYGRWAFVRGGWCWVPGPVAVRPVYAPALVAFVGGISIGVGTAPVGWFPLAPREVFVPWYRTSPRYVQNVNVTNTRVTVVQVRNVYNNYTVNRVTNVTYVNQRVSNSVTVVNHETFVNARPVSQNIVRVDQRRIASARVTPAVVNQVQPARQSVTGVARPVAYRPPAQALRRPVVATRQPVALSRPAAAAPAFARPVVSAPMRTVRAAPPREAQPLERGARGGPPAGNGGM
ncbi:MAG: FecR domain-containing protein, partial [Acidobacteria bacterium]|nr:FecR domain-containing protein [Acidobacteriota bacterium]